MTLRQDLHVRQGETWSFVYTKRDAAGVLVDLTGYAARMAVKDRYNGARYAYLSSGADASGGSIALGGAAGTTTLSMTATQTASLVNVLSALGIMVVAEGIGRTGTERFFDISKPIVRLIYDLELVSAAGVVTREIEGRFFVHREVTT